MSIIFNFLVTTFFNGKKVKLILIYLAQYTNFFLAGGGELP